MAGSRVSIRDNGLGALTKRLAAIGKGYTLTVGVHGPEGAVSAASTVTTKTEPGTNANTGPRNGKFWIHPVSGKKVYGPIPDKYKSSQTSQAGSGGITLLEVATINEFGLGNVPERSFIRDWADQNEARNADNLRKVAAVIIRGGYTIEVGLGRLGALYQGEIQNRISAGIPPPNAPSTIQKKGSSTPLINTGQLRSSILWKLEKS